jgi:nitroimidazol reductase NimA-like FMN-containing flavoprotein (pyridoxamine 5'-phosphate oxidase superfamily)
VTTTCPSVRSLSDPEARALLTGAHVGRLGYLRGTGVDIEPVTYTAEGDWIFGRTGVGGKTSALATRPTCAFEVDVVSGPFDWKSVVVQGSFYLLDPEAGSPALYDRALASVRALVPDAFSANDPAPLHTMLFGMYVGSVTGRASESATASDRGATAG